MGSRLGERSEAVRLFVLRGVGLVLALAFESGMLRVLGPEEYATAAVVLAAAAVVSIVVRLGTDGLAVRELSAGRKLSLGPSSWIVRDGTARLIPAMAVAAALVLLTVDGWTIATVAVCLLAGIGQAVWRVVTAALLGLGQRVAASVNENVIHLALPAAVLIVGEVSDDGIEATALVGSVGVGYILASLLVSSRKLDQSGLGAPVTDVASMRSSARTLAAHGAAGLLLVRLELVVLAFFLEPGELASYAFISRLGTSLNIVLYVVNQLAVQRIGAARDVTDAAAIVTRAARTAAIAVAPLAAAFVVLAAPVTAVLGPSLAVPALLPVFVALGQFMNTLGGSAVIGLNLHHAELTSSRILWTALPIHLVLLSVGAHAFGPVGAAGAAALTVGGWNVAMRVALARRAGAER